MTILRKLALSKPLYCYSVEGILPGGCKQRPSDGHWLLLATSKRRSPHILFPLPASAFCKLLRRKPIGAASKLSICCLGLTANQNLRHNAEKLKRYSLKIFRRRCLSCGCYHWACMAELSPAFNGRNYHTAIELSLTNANGFNKNLGRTTALTIIFYCFHRRTNAIKTALHHPYAQL